MVFNVVCIAVFLLVRFLMWSFVVWYKINSIIKIQHLSEYCKQKPPHPWMILTAERPACELMALDQGNYILNWAKFSNLEG